MQKLVIVIALCACLGSLTVAFPFSADDETTSTPVAAESASPTAAALTSSAPATDDTTKDTTSSMPVSSANDHVLNTTLFTCYNRPIGYYADVEHQCKVYHFCLIGDYNGDTVYQRISYLCLNETVFDQQALDCVDSSKITAPCKDSDQFFEHSNQMLRQAIVSKSRDNKSLDKVDSAAAAPVAPAAPTTTVAPSS